MDAEFGNSRLVSTIGLSVFVLGISLGPMFLSPLSEFYGRRPIYLVSWSMYVIWIIPSAVAKNIATMLVARFFDGLSGSAFLAVSGGTVSDLFARHELQAPMLMYSLAPFIGPCIGPLIGGFVNYNAYWRWTYYVMIIWAFALLVAIVVFVPETYRECAPPAVPPPPSTNPPVGGGGCAAPELVPGADLCVTRSDRPAQQGPQDPKRER